MFRKRLVLAILIIPVLLIASCAGDQSSRSSARPRRMLVSAAISLKDAFNEVKVEFERDHKEIDITYNFAASGSLQAQIEQGASVDVFASAGESQMDDLERKGLLLSDTRRDFAGNTSVLVVPANSTTTIVNFSDLSKPEIKRFAVGNPDSVPAGSYARQILEDIGLWSAIKNKLVLGESVRQVLTYVEQGNVEAGIVYSTDAASSKKVRVVATAPEGSSRPIVYPIAAIAGSKSPEEARLFVEFVSGPKGRAILAKYGFLPPPQ